MRNNGDAPLFPRNPAAYLTEWLFEIGPSVAGTMGESPLGYRDFAAWQEISGVALMPWEARILRRLSGDYLGQRHRAEEPACPAPYAGEIDDIAANRARVSQQIKRKFSQLKRKE